MSDGGLWPRGTPGANTLIGVTSRVLVILVSGLVLVGGAAALFLLRSSTERLPESAATPTTTTPTNPGPALPSKPTTPKPGAPVTTAKPAAPEPTPEAKPALGTLHIESDVPETSVFIDRVYLGNAPVTARNLAPGPHRLNMSVTGYEGVAETIDVEPGEKTISIKFKEIKLDEGIDVVHKHGIGSCSGTLKASPQRLSYETTNTGDAFAVALTNLDTFQMDYVARTLRVKVRDGKTYNFTPHGEEAKADALYVFHQNVEKVRQRLLSGR